MKVITVFCGSSYGKDTQITSDIKDIGAELGKIKSHILYGGGLYGHLKDLMESVGQHGGTMDAIISPAYFDSNEIYPRHVNIIQATDDEDRIKKFLESDACIVTPGGDGTLAESFFAHNRNLSSVFSKGTQKPIVFLNTNDFYSNIISHFNHMTHLGYSNETRQENLYFEDNPDKVMSRILSIK